MIIKYCRLLPYFFCLFISYTDSFGCGPHIAPTYSTPSFIDLDYKAQDNVEYESSYTGKMVRILFSEYLSDIITDHKKTSDNQNYFSNNIGTQKNIFASQAHKMLIRRGIKRQLSITSQNNSHFSNNLPLCLNNNSESALAFLNAVLTDKNAKDNYWQLAQIRMEIFDLCYANYNNHITKISVDLTELRKKGQNYYADYLMAISYFYTNQLNQAEQIFASLAKEGGGWVKETSHYMQGRVALIKAQNSWNGDGSDLSSIRLAQLSQALSAFNFYAENYPNGIYVKSALNVRRKIYFLQGNQKQLDILLKENISQAFDTGNRFAVYEALTEFNSYFKGQIDITTDHPLLIAYGIITKKIANDNSLADLTKAKDRFNHYPGLYNFAKLAVLNRYHKYQEIVTSEQSKLTDTPSSISSEIIRARALAALGKNQAALSKWQNINKIHHGDDIAQIELASSYMKNNLPYLLLKDKHIINQRILEDFVQFFLSTSELQELLKNPLPNRSKGVIGRELLKRYLLSGQFSEMKKIYDLGFDLKIYKNIQVEVEKLANNSDEAQNYLKIALFMIDNYLTPGSPTMGQTSIWDVIAFPWLTNYCLKCSPVHYANLITPYEYLAKAAAKYSYAYKDEQGAETLHYLVYCFKGLEPKDRCQWNKKYKNEGKKWHNILKNKYPQSKWIRFTPYYYSQN